MMARRKQIAAAQAKNLCIFMSFLSLLPLLFYAPLYHAAMASGTVRPDLA